MKYCIITYIFGKNKETLKEPLVVDDGVEYICVTDQKGLRSKTWRIVYDVMPNIKSLRDKMANVKYNPFKYTNADKILVMDGTMEIKSNITTLFESFDGYHIGLKNHPCRSNLEQELPCWKKRGLPQTTINKFGVIAKSDRISLSDVKLYETCLILYNNDELCRKICEINLKYMRFLGDGNDMIITNQCPFSYVMHKFFGGTKIFSINQKGYFNRYSHNSKKINNQ